MPKKDIFQDMVKVKREREMKSPPKEPPVIVREYRPKEPEREGSKNGIWLLAIVSIVFLFFAISLLFVKAEVKVVPETKNLTYESPLSAAKDSGSAVTFDLMVLSGREERSVPGGEEKTLNEPAKGTAVIYNSFSAGSQNLDINTRLEGSNGKIYKTDKKTTVPGMKKDGTPGQVEVGIYASEPGEAYNSGPLDFKIFGFKGSPKYEKFYGRSKSEITGGASGTTREVSPEQREAAISEMKPALAEKLKAKAKEQIPDGFILWDDAAFVETGEAVLSAGDDPGTTRIVLEGTLYGFLFKEDEISKEIIKNSIKDYDGSEAYVANLPEMKFVLSDRENINSMNVNSVKNINFSLSGNAKAVYRVDREKLAAELIHRKKSEFERILSKYPHVESAELSLRPFWKRTMPEKMEDVEIEVAYP